MTRNNLLLALVGILTLAGGIFLAGVVIWPAYQKPTNRTYESKLGYPALRRAMGAPFEVKTTTVQQRKITVRQLGEGRIASMPIRVPILPTDRIVEVAVNEGDRVKKGQVLARLDPSLARLRAESAKLMADSAQSELERVKLGSTYTLSKERPEQEEINLDASKKLVEILRERHKAMQALYGQGGASRMQLLELEARLAEVERDLRSNQLGVDVSSKGQPQSAAIAENNLRQQQNLHQQRLKELEDYTVVAPADGVLESVRVQPGEYNRMPGEVGFVIASGLWFEAHVDQTGIHKVAKGDRAQVYLEALPGEKIDGVVSRVVPIVTYDSGGPEAAKPTRAIGMGAPEWPTTFVVIVDLPPGVTRRLAPGLTGFVRLEAVREAPAVPLAAVTSISAKRGFVTCIVKGERVTREVVLGDESDGWVEIKEGLSLGDVVAVAGHEDLREDDRFRAAASTP